MKTPTYEQVREKYIEMFGAGSYSSCKQASVRESLGLTKRIAYNRIDANTRKVTCSEQAKNRFLQVFAEFGINAQHRKNGNTGIK